MSETKTAQQFPSRICVHDVAQEFAVPVAWILDEAQRTREKIIVEDSVWFVSTAWVNKYRALLKKHDATT